MDKIQALHDLLPDFQKFLDDLCQIKLTSDLEDKAQFYRQRITDYIEQFSSMPGAVPPPLPDPSSFPRDSDPNLDELIAEERIRSRQQFSNTLPISLSNGHSSHGELLLSEKVSDELKRQSAQPEEDFYEAPMDQSSSVPPPVPDSERPPVAAIRQIDDLPAYDDPDSPQMSPPPVTGHPPSLPRPTSNQGYHVLNPEGQDSGGTFTTSTISSIADDGELYEDLNDNGEYDDSFSDYESDELEVLNPDTDSGVISPSSTKEKKKKKKDDWQNFLNFIEAENNTCDHAGRLHFYDAKSTLKNIFKPKVYFCAATNARLLGYLPKKEYGKPQIDIQLHSGCEISSMGKDSNKEYGIQVQAKKGKTYNFSSSTQMDADKWIETLKKYTNQGLEYDVTHVTEHSESIDSSDVTSPPAGIEDPMIGKFETLMKKVFKNKKKKHPPQITEEEGVLQGFANVMGALYGEAKWQKKWIIIRNHQFSCHKNKGDEYDFAFSLKDVELSAPEQKIIKKGREGALKFTKDNETLIYLEALNPLDVGKIMKQVLNAMMVSSSASKSSLVKRETTVEKITKFYEALESGVGEQAQRKETDELYINTMVGGGGEKSSAPTSPDSEASTPEVSGVQANRLYVNTKIGGGSGGKGFRKLSSRSMIEEETGADDDIYEDTANVQNAPPPLPESRKANTLPSAMPQDSSTSIYGNIKQMIRSDEEDEEDEMYLEVFGNPGDKLMPTSPTTAPVSTSPTSPSATKLLKKATALFSASPIGRRKKDSEAPKAEPEEEPEEGNFSKKDSKKKKKDKKDKKKKKSKKDEIEHPDEPPPDPPQSYDTPIPAKQPVTRQLTENKFKDSDKKHLLDADRLQGEKTDVLARKKELSEIKKDIQNKRKSVDDPTEKANLDQQFKSVQAEWSACSKRLADIEDEIEKATKAAVPQSQLMRNSPASLRRGREGSDSRRSSGSSHGTDGGAPTTVPGLLMPGRGPSSLTSPERECASSDMSLQEKIKRFQQK